jgi:hypothetical protein
MQFFSFEVGAKFVERVDEKKGQRSLFQGQAAL